MFSLKFPYIGVSGLTNPSQIEDLADSLAGSGRMLSYGILASSETLAGQPGRHPRRYPKAKEIMNVFSEDPRVLNIIHFSLGTGKDLEQELDKVIKIGLINPQYFNGVQLNVPWPKRNIVAWLSRMLGPTRLVILEVEVAGIDSQELVQKLSPYVVGDNHADSVLLNFGGGDSGIDLELCRQHLQAIKEADLEIDLGIAGGLCASEVSRLSPLFLEYPELSSDAESRLRRPDDDRYEPDRGRAYVKRMSGLSAPAPITQS